MKPGQLSALLLLLPLAVFASSTLAQEEVFRARLSPMPTTPQTVDQITGAGEVILTLQDHTLTLEGDFKGMSSAATMAHIHEGPPAQPGPVAHPLQVTAANAGTVSGQIELTDEQIAALRANSYYIQIHSENNPPGELRGWIFPRRQ